jgi:aquaporin Z
MTSPSDGIAAPTSQQSALVYAIDGALLGLFMVSACLSVALLEHPASALHAAIPSAFARRALIGCAMGLTAVGLIYSPWGKRSGAFMNPAMVLCFTRLGKLSWSDAAGYIVAQLGGSALGVLLSVALLPNVVSHPAVNYVVTAPGEAGELVAWIAEFSLSFALLSTVMTVNRSARLAPYAGLFAATLVALFITFEAPLSGMSINPARSFGSALLARSWSGFWIYLTAPVAGMLCGVELQRLLTRRHERLCGKLSHDETITCFVRCSCLKETEARHV